MSTRPPSEDPPRPGGKVSFAESVSRGWNTSSDADALGVDHKAWWESPCFHSSQSSEPVACSPSTPPAWASSRHDLCPNHLRGVGAAWASDGKGNALRGVFSTKKTQVFTSPLTRRGWCNPHSLGSSSTWRQRMTHSFRFASVRILFSCNSLDVYGYNQSLCQWLSDFPPGCPQDLLETMLVTASMFKQTQESQASYWETLSGVWPKGTDSMHQGPTLMTWSPPQGPSS